MAKLARAHECSGRFCRRIGHRAGHGLGPPFGQGALKAKLAACANIVPAVESHYWWKGKLESSDEVLLIFKTRQQLLPKLERAVREIHPYDTPEFVALPLTTGSRKYLAWLTDNTVKE